MSMTWRQLDEVLVGLGDEIDALPEGDGKERLWREFLWLCVDRHSAEIGARAHLAGVEWRAAVWVH